MITKIFKRHNRSNRFKFTRKIDMIKNRLKCQIKIFFLINFQSIFLQIIQKYPKKDTFKKKWEMHLIIMANQLITKLIKQKVN